MANIALLIICFLIGTALRATRRAPAGTHLALFAIVINVALPALILRQIHAIQLEPGLILPVLMPWLLFGLSAALFALIGRALHLPRIVIGALVMTGGLGNTSFVGLPMIETFYGAQGLPTGILIDQLGTYLVLGTLGIVTVSYYGTGRPDWHMIARRIVAFPPLLALILALALSPFAYPLWLDTMLQRLGDMLAPLALISVGMQLQFGHFRDHRITLCCGLGFKLVLAPLAMALLYVGLLPHGGDTSRITVFEAAMGPQIGGGIIAMQYGMNEALVTLMVTIGIALSFLTVPLWYGALALF